MRQGFESPQPPLREKVYRQIKSMIFSGQIEAGNPLSELEISRMINVGRTPIRESLLQLTGEGLVQYTHNRGFSVAPVTLQDLRDSYELRELIETRSVELICQQATEDQLAELDRICEQFDARSASQVQMNDIAHNNQVDRDFHTHIVRCSGNRQFMKAWCGCNFVRAIVKVTRMTVDDSRTKVDERLEEKKRHRHLVALFRERKTEQAVEAIRAHIRDAAAKAIAVYQDQRVSDDYLWM